MTDEVQNKKWDMLKWRCAEQPTRDVIMNRLLSQTCERLDEEQLKAISYVVDGIRWDLFMWYEEWLRGMVQTATETAAEELLEVTKSKQELRRLKNL